MAHEQKITALIEAGEKAGEDGHADWFDQDDKRFYRRAAHARDSIKLLAEIAEAACTMADSCTTSEAERVINGHTMSVLVRSHDPEKLAALDALLAKYKEAQDAE